MSLSTHPHPNASRFAGRYDVVGELGRGGMGVVYRVRDTATGGAAAGGDVALKHLLAQDGKNGEAITRLFEQEFHTLSHLAHPRIVRVYDYGKDAEGVHYTMEYLDGGDLRELSPLPWARVCALLRDVCSALSLLHSRRLVHRDLTPRNIRCTADGKAKLIDLGAMTQAGPCRRLVGTPAYVAPEVLMTGYVDARTDLFALGATAYHALTGHNAFRANRFEALQSAWRSPPLPPSHYVPDLPPELDDLVMSLLHVQPLARPASAAEVMELLSAIAGLSLDEQLVVHQAYLSTPMLAGREQSLLRARKHLLRADAGHAVPWVVRGRPGVGRSRFLDAFALEAKLLGATVLRADAGDGAEGDWGVARALVRQLFEALPEDAATAARPHADVLVHAVPDLPGLLATSHDGAPAVTRLASFDNPLRGRARVGEAVQRFMVELLESRFVVLAIDDFDRIDGPSMAVLGWLARATEAARWVLAATVEGEPADDGGGLHAWLLRSSASLVLAPLDSEQTLTVLTSVFGDVPNVRPLADQLFAVSQGNPRALMHLAQHLLDRGVVRYEAGHWIVPERIDAADLPKALEDALAATLEGLSEGALEFAQALALSELARLGVDECRTLVGDDADADGGARIVRVLDELVAADVVRADPAGYGLRHPSWAPALLERLLPAAERRLHLRMAEIFRGRPYGQFRVVQHLLEAGRAEAAIDGLVQLTVDYEHAEAEDVMSAYDYALAMPRGWEVSYRRVIEASASMGRAERERCDLRWHLVSFAAVTAVTPREEIALVSQQLHRDCGLDIYAALDPALPAAERLTQALTQAQARFDQTPDHARAWSPGEAIPRLARTLLHIMGAAGRAYDYDMLESAPSLEPLAALSPALAAIEESRKTTLHLLGGRTTQAHARLKQRVESLSEQGIDGLDDRTRLIMRDAATWMLGTLEAQAGMDGAERHVEAIEHSPLYEVSAWRIRAQYAMRLGNMKRAEKLKQHVELLRMRNKPPQIHEGTELWVEALAYAETDDLIRVKEAIPRLEQAASEHPAWAPCLEFVRGQYQRLRGDHARAIEHFERALAGAAPGRHLVWAPATGARIAALIELQRHDEAKQAGLAAYETLERHELQGLAAYVRCPLALALARAGETEAAKAHADAVLAYQEEAGVRGIALGLALETRARVALLAGDERDFYAHAERCAEQFRGGRNPALTAKYERLVREATRRGIGVTETLASAAIAGTTTAATDLSGTLATALGKCGGAAERVQRALRLIAEAAEASAGYLYLMRDTGPVMVAQVGAVRPSGELDSAVAEYLAHELRDLATQTATAIEIVEAGSVGRAWRGEDGTQFVPLMVAHPVGPELAITGIALVTTDDPERFAAPHDLLRAISETLASSGDADIAAAS